MLFLKVLTRLCYFFPKRKPYFWEQTAQSRIFDRVCGTRMVSGAGHAAAAPLRPAFMRQDVTNSIRRKMEWNDDSVHNM